jgi:thymidylate kinase
MPEIVEILAPSGTGKTTLYKGLQKKWTPDDPWSVYHDFRYKRKLMYRFPKDYFLVLQRKINNLKKNFLTSEIQYKQNSAREKPNEKKFYEQYPEFCDTAMELILEHNVTGFNNEDKRFLNTFFLFETIEHLQAVLNHADDKRLCIMDEGLLSRLMHLNSPTFTEKELTRYLKFIPVPSAVVYLKCDAEFIVERILSRKKTATVHTSLSRDEILQTTLKTQQLMETTLGIVQEKGATILRVNAETDSNELANKVYDFVKQGNIL